MRKDVILTRPIRSSFLGVSQDAKSILQTLFVTSKPYSDRLKRLLLVNQPDCLDESNQLYKEYIDSKSLGDLINQGYIRLKPKMERGQHEEIKTYIIVSFDNFSSSANPEFRDFTLNFDIICYNDNWCLNDFKIRPIQVCGYCDGILGSVSDKNKISRSQHIRLSGIGEYNFLGCNQAILNEDLGMYTLSYRAVHFTEDNQTIGEITNA